MRDNEKLQSEKKISKKMPLECGILRSNKKNKNIVHKGSATREGIGYFLEDELIEIIKEIKDKKQRKLIEQEYYINKDIALEMKNAKNAIEAKKIRAELIIKKFGKAKYRGEYEELWIYYKWSK